MILFTEVNKMFLEEVFHKQLFLIESLKRSVARESRLSIDVLNRLEEFKLFPVEKSVLQALRSANKFRSNHSTNNKTVLKSLN